MRCSHEKKTFACDVLMKTKRSHAMFSWEQNVRMRCSRENKLFSCEWLFKTLASNVCRCERALRVSSWMGEVSIRIEIHYTYTVCPIACRIPVSVCAKKLTVHNIQTLSVNQWEGNSGKMENTNTQIRELYLSWCMQQKFQVMWFLLEIPIWVVREGGVLAQSDLWILTSFGNTV